jgi:hypothetical protein
VDTKSSLGGFPDFMARVMLRFITPVARNLAMNAPTVLIAAPPQSLASPLPFWRGLIRGLVFSAASWAAGVAGVLAMHHLG